MALPTAQEIERAGLKCWPGIEVEWDGMWVRRASNGYTKRANSAQCFDPADDDDVEPRIAATRGWFEARGLTPTFRVNLLTGPRLGAALARQGWTGIDPSRLMAMELDPVAAHPRGEIYSARDPVFLNAQRKLKDLDDATVAQLDAVLAVLDVPAAGIVLHDEAGEPVSSSVMAVAAGIVITGNVVTDPARRRQGYARAMMETGHAWALSQGARFAALNVQASNPPAVALYESLGYRPQYDYLYHIPGAA